MRPLAKIAPLLLLCLLFGGAAQAERSVVLVVRADSPIEAIELLDVRKLYLGFSVRTGSNQPIRAATNRADPVVYEVFLQDVMAMSASRYDRRLLTLTLQSGRPRPLVVQNSRELLQALQADPHLVTFMWKDDAEKAGDLKILRVLWVE